MDTRRTTHGSGKKKQQAASRKPGNQDKSEKRHTVHDARHREDDRETDNKRIKGKTLKLNSLKIVI